MESDVGPASATFSLTIEPDTDIFAFTHLKGPMDNVVTIQECPKPIRDMIGPVIAKLIQLQIRSLNYDPGRGENFAVIFKPKTEPRPDPITGKIPPTPEPVLVEIPFPKRKKALEALRITAWWVEHERRRLIAKLRAHEASDPSQIHWVCPNCNERVSHERSHCRNHECPSWDMLHIATDEPTLHLVNISGNAPA